MIQPSVWWNDKGGCDTHGHTMLPETQSLPVAHTGFLSGTNPSQANARPAMTHCGCIVGPVSKDQMAAKESVDD